jgi:hypothetical protein
MKHHWTDTVPTRLETSPVFNGTKRASERRSVVLPARLTWKDQRGTARFAMVVTRDVSDFGVYVETQSVVSIPLYRIVQFQFERDVLASDLVPAPLRQGRVLSAVYRVTPPTREGGRQGFALRLMVDPKRYTMPIVTALSA